MAITIIKKTGLGKLVLKQIVAKPAQVEQRLTTEVPELKQAEPTPTPPKKVSADAWKSFPVSPTLEHFYANRATHRPPEPRACTLCGKFYPYPCDGAKDSTCVTAVAVRKGTYKVPA